MAEISNNLAIDNAEDEAVRVSKSSLSVSFSFLHYFVGQSFQVFNNPIQYSGNNGGVPGGGLPELDVQMGFESEDNPLEFTDGNKLSRKTFDAVGSSILVPAGDAATIVSAGLIDQSRQET
ncbi:hypothetical protein V6N13_015014 [Hibiscus sabdariffa]